MKNMEYVRRDEVRRDENGRFVSCDVCKRIKMAVVRLIRYNFSGIVGFYPWFHPDNRVLNCFALTLDGVVQYKFQWTRDGLTVADVLDRHWINLPVKVGDVITWKQLEKMIPKAKVRDVFHMTHPSKNKSYE
jgi:hypothetical protein